MFQSTLLLSVLCFCCVWSAKITLPQGVLEGIENQSRGGRNFHSFLGIPFAEPPVGDLRFRSPEPHSGWTGVWNASSEGNMCIQDVILIPELSGVPLGSEDCLYMNIHTPEPNPAKKYPVMVFIYGGAFQMGDSGSKTYGPFYLLDRDVVYVSFNYRLGILGFLSFEDERLPGNFGLKDQLLALKWIKANIEAFGGDPNSITIFGESAGAASVHYHLLSPKSQGLFHRAILQSGSSFCPWAFIPQERSKLRAEAAATLLKCFGNLDEIISCLKRRTAEAILRTQLKFVEWTIDPVVSFAPVAEVPHSDAFITQHPYLYQTSSNIPLIFGVNKDEGAIRTSRLCANNMFEVNQLNKDWDTLLPITLMTRDTVKRDQVPFISKSLKSYYLQDQHVTENNIQSLSDMFSDILINFHTLKAAEHASGPVYFYRYDYENQVSWSSVFGNCSVPLGVSHADELTNFFNLNSLFKDDFQLKGKHLEMSQIMIQLWTNFAKTGIPTDDKKQIEWKQFNDVSGGGYLHIGDHTFTMQSKLFKERMEYIESLPFIFNQRFLLKQSTKDEL